MPLVVVLLQEQVIQPIIACVIFTLFVITDFLDGHLARKYGQTSELGKLLDPFADKMLLVSTIIPLTAYGKVPFIVSLILVIREIYLMGLREIALYYGFAVEVRISGKLKTVMQSLYLFFVLLHLQSLAQIFMYAALIFTLYSAYEYSKIFIRTWRSL